MKINEDFLTYGYLNCKNLGQKNTTFDLNDLNVGETCHWTSNNPPINAPFGGGRCYCFYGYGSYKYQLCVQYNTNIVTIRHTWNGEWSNWETLITKTDATTLAKSQINQSTYKTNVRTLNFNTVTTHRFLTGSGRGCALVGYAGAEGAWGLYLLTWNDNLASFQVTELKKIGTFITTPSFTTYIDSSSNTYGIDFVGRRYSNAFVVQTATTFTYNNIASTS